MIDVITRLVQPVVQIRRQEWRQAILMFLYFFITISTLYVLKPVRNSIFLTAHGAENLRYAYVGEGLFLAFFTFFYISLARLLKKKNIFFSFATIFFITNLLIFRFLFGSEHIRWSAFVFYVWYAAYSITIVTQFWTLANDVFDPQQAKRLFGFIVSGGSLGGICGGFLTQFTAERLGTENLLFVVSLMLAACVVLINMVWHYEHGKAAAQNAQAHASDAALFLRQKSTWREFFGSRHLLLIAALVAIAKIASTLVDNQFNAVVELTISGPDAETVKNVRTAFFGKFGWVLNGFSFFMQLVIASRVIKRFGIGASLLLLPVGLCLGATATLWYTILSVAMAAKIFDGSMNYSIYQISKEILYLPVPSHVRYRVKPLVDMLIYRSSKMLGGLMIIIAAPLLHLRDEKLGIVLLFLIPVWILAVWGGRRAYVRSIKQLLFEESQKDRPAETRSQEAAEILANLEGERSFDKLKAFMIDRSSVTRKMSATACLAFYSSSRDVSRVRKLAAEMIRYEALELKKVDLGRLFQEDRSALTNFLDKRLFELLKAEQSSPPADLTTLLQREEKNVLLKVAECIGNPSEETDAKLKSLLILTALGTQGAVDVLLSSLASVKDLSIRFNIIRALNRIRAKGENRKFSPWVIKQEIKSELANHQAFLTVMDKHHRFRSSSFSGEDYLQATLQAIQEESLERIFRLLALLYDSEVIEIIYDQLVASGADSHIRANALELLENVVEPELVRMMSPVLDTHRRGRVPNHDFEKVITDFLAHGDRWLSVCILFLIAEMELKHFYHVFQEKMRSKMPVIREAAEIALMKARNR